MIGRFVGNQLGRESEDVAVQGASIFEHEFDEVAFRGFRDQFEAVAQRVLFPAESVVWRNFYGKNRIALFITTPFNPFIRQIPSGRSINWRCAVLTFILFARWWCLVLHRSSVGNAVLGTVKFLCKIVHVAKNEFPSPNIDDGS